MLAIYPMLKFAAYFFTYEKKFAVVILAPRICLKVELAYGWIVDGLALGVIPSECYRDIKPLLIAEFILFKEVVRLHCL